MAAPWEALKYWSKHFSCGPWSWICSVLRFFHLWVLEEPRAHWTAQIYFGTRCNCDFSERLWRWKDWLVPVQSLSWLCDGGELPSPSELDPSQVAVILSASLPRRLVVIGQRPWTRSKFWWNIKCCLLVTCLLLLYLLTQDLVADSSCLDASSEYRLIGIKWIFLWPGQNTQFLLSPGAGRDVVAEITLLWCLSGGWAGLGESAARGFGFGLNKAFDSHIVPMPVGSCHKIRKPSRPGRSCSGRSWRFMQIGWLSDIYLLPFSPSVLATLNQMDKLMENKAGEEAMLLLSSKMREHSLSSFRLTWRGQWYTRPVQNWYLTFGDHLKHSNRDLPCSITKSNRNPAYQPSAGERGVQVSWSTW